MNECIVCREIITNTVCIDCVEHKIENWLYESKPELVKTLKRKTDELFNTWEDTYCILCKNHMSICTFCYVKPLKMVKRIS